MSYLAVARSIVTGYERNEIDEISPRLSPEEAERLKAAIVDAATVDSLDFDRAAFDRLWEQWNAHEAALKAADFAEQNSIQQNRDSGPLQPSEAEPDAFAAEVARVLSELRQFTPEEVRDFRAEVVEAAQLRSLGDFLATWPGAA